MNTDKIIQAAREAALKAGRMLRENIGKSSEIS